MSVTGFFFDPVVRKGCSSGLLRMIRFGPDASYPSAFRIGRIISSRTESSLKPGDSKRLKSKLSSGAGTAVVPICLIHYDTAMHERRGQQRGSVAEYYLREVRNLRGP